jgi:cytochrome c-type biogenesis protein CcsB
MSSVQHYFLLLAAACYAAATVFCFAGLVNEKKRRWAVVLIVMAFLAISTVFGLRAVEARRLPGLGLYEMLLANNWVGSLVFLLLVLIDRRLFAAGLAVLPTLALVTVKSLFAFDTPRMMPPEFYSFWFYAHTQTTRLAFGFILAGTALGAVLLLKEKAEHKGWLKLNKLLPPQSLTDSLSWHLIGMGFVFYGLMIVSGGLWADSAWGRFWAWDPIETWSLITWLMYAILLHLRRLHGWHGKRAAVLQAAAFIVLVFSLFYVGLFFTTIHEAYI